MTAAQIVKMGFGETRVVTGSPSGSGLMGSDKGGAPVYPRTWGDRLLRRRHQRVRLEPATQTQVFPNGEIDGELYTAHVTRGNVEARVIRGGTPKHPKGSTYLLHPFTNGGVAAQMPMQMYRPRLRMVRDSPSPSTLATARPIEPPVE